MTAANNNGMTRRTDRIGSLVRNTIGELLLSKISDPRIDPAKISITRVEVSPDFLQAKVYVSVLGSEADQRKALWGLKHAAGHLQELMMRQIKLRNTPMLVFLPDESFKKTMKTLELIQQAMSEIEEKEQAHTENPDCGEELAQGDD